MLFSVSSSSFCLFCAFICEYAMPPKTFKCRTEGLILDQASKGVLFCTAFAGDKFNKYIEVATTYAH